MGENENLFPPLNVHATSLSPESIQIDWTDWHLKPEDDIPDDRHYLVRYNIEKSNAKYQFRNSSERNLIITDLKPNTLYDFAVRLVIGRRESDWSMTTSQMTMELSAKCKLTKPEYLILKKRLTFFVNICLRPSSAQYFNQN